MGIYARLKSGQPVSQLAYRSGLQRAYRWQAERFIGCPRLDGCHVIGFGWLEPAQEVHYVSKAGRYSDAIFPNVHATACRACVIFDGTRNV